MAFDPARLSVAVDTIAGGSLRIHFYLTADNQAAVTATGYITNAAKLGVRLGDAVVISDGAENYMTRVASMSGGSATLVIDALLSHLVDFLSTATGAQRRTARSKFMETVSVLDFIPAALHSGIGDGTGSTDLSPYFDLAKAHFSTNSDYRGGRIVAPRGKYKLNGSFSFGTPYDHLHNIILEGEGGLSTFLDFSGVPATTDGLVIPAGGSHFGVSRLTVSGATRDNIQIGDGGDTFSDEFFVRDVRTQFAGRNNLRCTNSFGGSIENVLSKGAGDDGIVCAGFHTRLKVMQSGSASCAGSGWSLRGAVYSSFDTLSADGNSLAGYALANLAAVTFDTCGAETNAREAVKFYSTAPTGLPAGLVGHSSVSLRNLHAVGNNTSAGGYGTVGIYPDGAEVFDIEIDGGSDDMSGGNSIVATAGTGSIRLKTSRLNGFLGAFVKTGNVVHNLGELPAVGSLPNYANDAAAAVGGVAVGGFYRNGSVFMVRVA